MHIEIDCHFIRDA